VVERGPEAPWADAGPVARLGDLERAVMEVLWDLVPASGHERPGAVTARRVAAELAPTRSLAYTTVLTVLDRLERKRLVRRLRPGRAHLYAPAASRDAYVARLMLEALGSASDRDAALLRFVEGVSDREAALLRQALEATGPGHHGAANPTGQGRPATVARAGRRSPAAVDAAGRARPAAADGDDHGPLAAGMEPTGRGHPAAVDPAGQEHPGTTGGGDDGR